MDALIHPAGGAAPIARFNPKRGGSLLGVVLLPKTSNSEQRY